MATRLKNLRIKKVDFVDEGANPDANIRMIKRKDGEERTAKDSGKRDTGNILKRMFGFIGKAAGMNQKEIDSAMDEIQKGDSASFNEKINEVKNCKIADEMWDTCYALHSSLWSILNDEEMDSIGAATAMQESLDEFYKVVKESIKEWANGKSASIARNDEEVSKADLEFMKLAMERLGKAIKKANKDAKEKGKSKDDNLDDSENQEGEEKEMKIDKSKLTDAERAFLDNIEKRCGVEEDAGSGESGPTQAEQSLVPEPVVEKSTHANTVEVPVEQTDESDNIYKGLHPAVKAELEELKKFRENVEHKELTEVAKKYAIIGKKEEELVPLFKSLKVAGGTAYNDMIAVLDQAVDTVEKSGAFSEIGKSGHGSGSAGAAEAKIETIAKSYMESDATLDYSKAIAKAWEDNPDLLAEYDEQEGF